MEWIATTCLAGAHAAGRPRFETADYNFGAATGQGTMLRCPDCRSLYPDRFPAASALASAYSTYYTGKRTRSRARRMVRAALGVGRADYLRHHTPPDASTVLDYGCGSGEFLVELRHGGHAGTLVGTDFLPTSAPDGEFAWVPLDSFDAGPQRYQWITLSHVVEHLTEPRAAVARLASILADGGGLWIATPNAESVLLEAFGPFARDIDFPRHRQVYSREALTALLASHGFRVRYVPSPRMNTVLNAVWSARTRWRVDVTRGKAERATAILKALLRVAVHLALPARLAARRTPELVVIATRA